LLLGQQDFFAPAAFLAAATHFLQGALASLHPLQRFVAEQAAAAFF